MNYVDSFNLFGVEAKQIPCSTGKGAPTTSTEGAVGCLYMDTDTGDIYKCVAAEGGVYGWESVPDSFDPAPYNIPTVYLTGDTAGISKDNAVTLNYVYGERTGTCTLQWQGSSSLAYPKKNYTIKFDNAFEVVEGWGVQNKYCLKADWIDFSHCRNVVTAKLWGEMTKSRPGVDTRLAALPNAGAIDGFPCFVVINDKWQGVYNFNIPKDGWMMGMGSGENEAILCADNGPNSSLKAEVTIGSDFELEYNSDVFEQDDIQSSFNTMVNALLNCDGVDVDGTLSPYLDINSAIDYFILVVITRGIDLITKNAIFATYDGVKWFMSAYDLDSTWGLYWDGSKFLPSSYGGDFANCSFYRLPNGHQIFDVLYRYKKAEIVHRYKTLRSSVIDPSNVAALFRNYAKNIPHAAFIADNEMWTGIPSTGSNAEEQIIQWYNDRIKFVDAEIDEIEAQTKQIATEGLAYTTQGHSVYGTICDITGIGTVTDADLVIPKWIEDKQCHSGLAVVNVIGDYAFQNNENITSAVIPEGVAKIGNNAFQSASNLKSINIPSTVTTLGVSAFYGTAIEKIAFPDAITIVPNYVVSDCKELTNIMLGNRVAEIRERAFANCTSLTTMRLPNTVQIIGQYAFSNCMALQRINIPNSVTTIGEYAFNRLIACPSITIPASVKTIGANAFGSGWYRRTIIFKGTPESISEDAFFEMGTSLQAGESNIYVPWFEGEVAGAPWGAPTAVTIHYNTDTSDM